MKAINSRFFQLFVSHIAIQLSFYSVDLQPDAASLFVYFMSLSTFGS